MAFDREYVVLHTTQKSGEFLIHLEVLWRVNEKLKYVYIGSLRVKNNLACHEVHK